jgi:CheY-like chemotaxis protein
LRVHRANAVQVWSSRSIAEDVVAVVAASAHSVRRSARIFASGLAHRGRKDRCFPEEGRRGNGWMSGQFYASAHALRVAACDPGSVALRCLIVDDRPGFSEAARELLEGQGVTVVGVAASSAEAVRGVRELRPEVALVDIDLGADSGFDVARRLADEVDGSVPRVILISTHDEREFVKLIESSPAVGFLAKTELSAERIYQLLDSADT